MSTLTVSMSKKDNRPVVVFRRGDVLEGWSYLDELDEKIRTEVLGVLETRVVAVQ
jgi:hypothetical protein